MIRKTSLFLALPAVVGLLATSPAYAYWHRGFVGHGGWGRPGVGIGLGVAAGAAVGLAAGAALAAPRYVAPAPVVVAPPPVAYAPPPAYYAPPPVAYVP
jgi:hypothetical protein